MSTDRMRRVDEAVREVLSDAIEAPQGPARRVRHRDRCQDQPRSAPCPRVRERPRLRATERAARMDGLRVRPRRPAAARRPRAAHEAHADARVRLRRHRRARRRGSSGCSPRRRSDEPCMTATRDARPRARSATASASCSSPTRTPTATRSARSSRCTTCCSALGKDSVMFMSRRRVPAALRVPLLRPRRARPRCRRRTSTSARSIYPGLRQHRPQPARDRQARRHAHPQHRPPPRQHALRHGQPRRRRGVVHGRDRLGPDARRSASSRR